MLEVEYAVVAVGKPADVEPLVMKINKEVADAGLQINGEAVSAEAESTTAILGKMLFYLKF